MLSFIKYKYLMGFILRCSLFLGSADANQQPSGCVAQPVGGFVMQTSGGYTTQPAGGYVVQPQVPPNYYAGSQVGQDASLQAQTNAQAYSVDSQRSDQPTKQ